MKPRLLSLLWAVCLSAFAVEGMVQLRQALPLLPPPPKTSLASADWGLGGVGAERPAYTALAALEKIPASEAVLFVGRVNDPSFFQTLYALSELAYPRPVPWVACGAPSERVVPGTLTVRYGGALFYKTGPPAPDCVTLGERLAIGYGSRVQDPRLACRAIP
jgi:hypothetical protein